MKNEKLNLMKNKVVEYHNPKANGGVGLHFKAFLYKNHKKYSFKIVEVIAGTDIAFNDVIPVIAGDDEFLVVADKPKLMRVDKNSWHYRLMKYVLRNKDVPTPRDMQNGCPYFWLLIFSLIILPFKLLFIATKACVFLIPKMLFWILKQMMDSWIMGLDDEVAYDIYNSGKTRIPKTVEIYYKKKNRWQFRDEFFKHYLSKKYGKNNDDLNHATKRNEIKEKWDVWYIERDAKRKKQQDAEIARNDVLWEQKIDRLKKRADSKAKWDAKMEPFRIWRKETAIWFRKTFTVERGRVNMIVKRTKQFVGFIFTLIIIALTFIVVNFLAMGIMALINAIINGGWIFFVILGIAGAIIGIFYLLYILITSWGEIIYNKYNNGKKVWYIEPFIYLVYFPLKYVALSIYFVVMKILWVTIKFIFYTLIFNWFLKPIGLFIAKAFKSLVRGTKNSSGIFGEYFGASYSDYCPGIEWTGFDDED